MKILNILTDTNIGGAGRLLVHVLSNLDRARFDGWVVLPKDSALLPAVSSRLARAAPLGVPDYVALSDDATLAPLPPDATVSSPALLAIAVRFPSARLIDNTLLAP